MIQHFQIYNLNKQIKYKNKKVKEKLPQHKKTKKNKQVKII